MFFAETTCKHWPIMSVYERFEQIVAIVLSLVISVVIAVALVQLVARVVPLLLSGAINRLEHDVFQALFGTMTTLLIAMGFKHSIVRVALRALEHHPQVKTVVRHRAHCVESQIRHSSIPVPLPPPPAPLRRWLEQPLCSAWSTGCCASVMTASPRRRIELSAL